MPGKIWTTEQNELLKKIYMEGNLKELRDAFPQYSLATIRKRASRYGWNKYTHGNRSGNLTPLIRSDAMEKYYWIGFIFADGWISKTGQLVVQLSLDDREYLECLAKFLETSVKEISQKKSGFKSKNETCIRIAVQDKIVCDELRNSFEIKNQKTYNPPSIETLKKVLNTDDKIFSFFVGFFDGDGSISNKESLSLRLTNHESWHDVHNFFLDFLKKKFPESMNAKSKSIKIVRTFDNNRVGRYCHLALYRKKLARQMYKNIVSLDIPYMKRKWDKLKGI